MPRRETAGGALAALPLLSSMTHPAQGSASSGRPRAITKQFRVQNAEWPKKKILSSSSSPNFPEKRQSLLLPRKIDSKGNLSFFFFVPPQSPDLLFRSKGSRFSARSGGKARRGEARRGSEYKLAPYFTGFFCATHARPPRHFCDERRWLWHIIGCAAGSLLLLLLVHSLLSGHFPQVDRGGGWLSRAT